MVFELLGLWIGCSLCLLLSSLDSQRLHPERRKVKLPRASVRRSRRGAGRGISRR